MLGEGEKVAAKSVSRSLVLLSNCLTSTSHLAWFGFDIQFLDALPWHEGLQSPSSSDAGVGGGVRTVLEAFKQLVLLLVPGWRAERDGLHFGGGPHVQFILDGVRTGFVCYRGGRVLALLLLGSILQVKSQLRENPRRACNITVRSDHGLHTSH